MVGKTLTLCLTNYNRDKMLFESFEQVLDDDRVSEIVIVDDNSLDNYWRRVKGHCQHYPKIKLYRNQKNLGCYRNKREAISKATNDYVIIFDSDNIMTKGYIDKVFAEEWNPNVILAPDYIVSFDYRHFGGMVLDSKSGSRFFSMPRFDCLINTMNYFVNRDSYLQVWDGNKEPWTADTIYQNLRWVQSGRSIKVVVGMEYDHRIKHERGQDRSHYLQHNRKTGNLFNECMKQFKLMR